MADQLVGGHPMAKLPEKICGCRQTSLRAGSDSPARLGNPLISGSAIGVMVAPCQGMLDKGGPISGVIFKRDVSFDQYPPDNTSW